jgi:hypothetical protein
MRVLGALLKSGDSATKGEEGAVCVSVNFSFLDARCLVDLRQTGMERHGERHGERGRERERERESINEIQHPSTDA